MPIMFRLLSKLVLPAAVFCGGLTAVAPAGQVRWTWKGERPGVAGTEGHLYALQIKDGALAWKHPIGWSSASPAIGADGSVIAVSCKVDMANPNQSAFTVYSFKP